MRKVFFLAAFLAASVVVPASAASFANGNFEIGTDPGGSTVLPSGSGNITNWTTIGSETVYFGTDFKAYSGTRSVGVYATTGVGQSGVTQTFDVVPGKHYDVSFRYSGFPPASGDTTQALFGIRSNVSSGSQSSTVTVGFPKYFGGDIHTADHPIWLPVSFSFVAGKNEATLSILGVAGGIFASTSRGIVDNVEVTAVPIPMALPLFLAGLGALGVLRRARRSKTASSSHAAFAV